MLPVRPPFSSKDRDVELAALMSDMERNLTLLGITAIEDKLQDQVPKVLKRLLEARIRVWVITGDQ